MNTPSNPMWGSQVSKPQTIIIQQGQPSTAKQTISHHDYAISGQKLTKAGQQKQTVQAQLQQQKTIQVNGIHQVR